MPFTKQELTILHLLAKGLSAREIATRLNIKTSTFNNHRVSIKNKLTGTGITLHDLKRVSPEVFEKMEPHHDNYKSRIGHEPEGKEPLG